MEVRVARVDWVVDPSFPKILVTQLSNLSWTPLLAGAWRDHDGVTVVLEALVLVEGGGLKRRRSRRACSGGLVACGHEPNLGEELLASLEHVCLELASLVRSV